jgi:hypothetical protein
MRRAVLQKSIIIQLGEVVEEEQEMVTEADASVAENWRHERGSSKSIEEARSSKSLIEEQVLDIRIKEERK